MKFVIRLAVVIVALVLVAFAEADQPPILKFREPARYCYESVYPRSYVVGAPVVWTCIPSGMHLKDWDWINPKPVLYHGRLVWLQRKKCFDIRWEKPAKQERRRKE
jgi:hypothetical protein